MINEKLLEELKSFDLVKILRILTSYAGSLLKIMHIDKSKEPKDYAQEAFAKFISGDREWNKKAYPNIINFLKGAVESSISNDNKSRKKQATLNLIDNTNSNLQDIVPSTELTREELFESEEELVESENKASKIKNDIWEKIKGDDNLELYFDSLDENLTPKEFSEITGIDIKEVYNMIRKLKRITQNFLDNR